MDIDRFVEEVQYRNRGNGPLISAVRSVANSLGPFLADHPDYEEARVLERVAEPDRLVHFSVVWEDDEGRVRVNRGWRVQQSNAMGAYKGGLRFDTDVSASLFLALAFEQTFKNALTGLPLGGAKGGADFDPSAHSDREIMRFCRAFMTELHRHIGPHVDVPAGDIGVGEREIGYLTGAWRSLTGQATSALTGKGASWGGSPIRTEATGYGVVYFAQAMLRRQDRDLEGVKCLVSGAGKVALYAAEKLLDRGAVVLTLSDRGGTLHLPDGLDIELLEEIQRVKLQEGGRLSAVAEDHDLEFREDALPWDLEADLAFPCAVQDEIDADAARSLVDNGIEAVIEGANLPCTDRAEHVLRDAKVLRAPGKAANAGGVAISGLEMVQNRMNYSWSRSRVHEELRRIICDIHDACVERGDRGDFVDYPTGANIAAFERVGEAILAFGIG